MYIYVRPNQAMERLWKYNHWLCSHDNVWPSKIDFSQVVTQAIQKQRSLNEDLMIIAPDGSYVQAPQAIVPELKKREIGKEAVKKISLCDLFSETVGIPLDLNIKRVITFFFNKKFKCCKI